MVDSDTSTDDTDRTNPIATAPDPSPRCPECDTAGEYFKGREYDCVDDSCEVVTFDREGNVTYPDDWQGDDTTTDTERYRVSGYWDGRWQETEWFDTLEDAERAYRHIRSGSWLQLSVERSDGARKAGPDTEWYVDTGTDQ